MKIKINVSDGKNVFFISDFHIGHSNVIKFDNRPFLDKYGNPDLQAMYKTIIANWNDVVKTNDIVFYLGDLVFGRPETANELIWALNGKIHFVMGNHDEYKDIVELKRFETVNDLVDLTIKGDPNHKELFFQLLHYPIFSHRNASHGWYHIHGHCHGNLHHGDTRSYYNNRRAIDVGCNVINYTPISYKDVVLKLGGIFMEKEKRK
jgi:calcineurin-like phosphoesterase family protein